MSVPQSFYQAEIPMLWTYKSENQPRSEGRSAFISLIISSSLRVPQRFLNLLFSWNVCMCPHHNLSIYFRNSGPMCPRPLPHVLVPKQLPLNPNHHLAPYFGVFLLWYLHHNPILFCLSLSSVYLITSIPSAPNEIFNPWPY